ncbi:glycosyltransferase [Halobacteriovorax sp. RT-2-4]|uniref:glycosyltransferase n=1 Tax=unclassified Halobacteriovorax TaxID=2639665 RepID=UPI003999D631
MNYILIGTLAKGGAERQVSYLARLNSICSVFSFSTENFYNVEKHIPILTKLKCNRFLLLIFAPLFLATKLTCNDTLVSFMEFNNFINILCKLYSKHKAIVSVRTNPEYYFTKKLGFLYIFLIKYLYVYSDLIVCNSNDCREILIKMGLDCNTIVVIENGLDLDAISSKATTIKKNKSLIFCGRLDPVKNLDGLLCVFSSVIALDSEFSLTIIGDGVEKDRLRKLVLDMGLSDHVKFCGKQDNPFKYFYKGSTLLLTSYFEGSPNVIIEAMACGLAIVAADCKTGPREILYKDNSKFGVLLNVPVSSADYKIWAKNIIDIYSGEYSNYSKLAFERSINFNCHRILDKWDKHING